MLAMGLCPLVAVAQSNADDDAEMFQKYKIVDVFHGKPAPLDLSSSDARMYRTQLRYAIRQGPKFAGYYAVGTWGCGTGCTTVAIIDLRTGKSTFFATIQEWFDGGDFQLSELKYKLNSRAWHVIGDLNEQGKPADRWFLWTGDKFELIRTTPVKHGVP